MLSLRDLNLPLHTHHHRHHHHHHRHLYDDGDNDGSVSAAIAAAAAACSVGAQRKDVAAVVRRPPSTAAASAASAGFVVLSIAVLLLSSLPSTDARRHTSTSGSAGNARRSVPTPSSTSRYRTTQSTANLTFTIGFLPVTSSKLRTLPIKYHLGALPTAVEDVNEGILKDTGARLDYEWMNTDASTVETIKIMDDFRNVKKVHAFIGPSRTDCVTEAIVATAWNIPLISYQCQDDIVGAVDGKTTFVRTFPPKMKVVAYIRSIMDTYEWTNCVIFYGYNRRTNTSHWLETVNALKTREEDRNYPTVVDTRMVPEPFFHMLDSNDLKRDFDQTKKKTRVYIWLASHDALAYFVSYKHANTEGREAEYVVLAVTDKQEAPKPNDTSIFKAFSESINFSEKDVEPFRNVLLLCFRQPTNMDRYREFQEKSGNASITKFNVTNPFKVISVGKLKIPIEAAYLYDAVSLYGRTVKDALNQSIDPRDGLEMINLMKNRPYSSIKGYDIHIDSNGDSMANYSVYAVPKGSKRMTKVGQFSMSADNAPQYRPSVPEDTIWIDQMPRTIPVCGLDGSACLPMGWKIPVAFIAGIVILFSGFATVFCCRHYRYEQKLASLLWKMDFRELTIADADFNDPMMSEKPKDLTVHDFGDITQRRSSGRLLGGAGGRAGDGRGADDFLQNADDKRNGHPGGGIRVATYRGTLVAVRFLRRRHVEVPRSLRKELQTLKELQHDNINRFIGACVEPPNICINTQYCSRGSLKDILENADLHLDDMFIASLVFDLIRGMIFLHDSEIVSHGNLKSSNCLVDSRWVLQIADFGLHQLRGCELPALLADDEQYARHQWRAPELLRMLVPPPAGTQKGDVYSFAIILFEVHGRSGPWGPTMYSPKEIIEKVKHPPDESILRPDTSLLKCEDFIIRCMKECWREIPECRPDFKCIRMKLKPMQRGMKSNIFDNMLAMMEKYAYNLEAIVAERTEQLVEEKKKTEALLHRMLPKSVAEQLKRGQPVIPETYSAVTIYFSDIVGFTAISAESTPLEVVDMLNDLYTCFDSIIGEYDVYKVETIGDAYMVVSGLPIRNGDNHAGEIASMSLHLLRAIGNFQIHHRPNDRLHLRIGIHSGSVVAGVVGLKMPRFCLFGDTVNTASRMESTGEPLKIHCSQACRNILFKLGGYILEERGYVNMKGKGEMFTYFLTGEDKSHRLRRISVEKRPVSLDSSAFSVLRLSAPPPPMTASSVSLHSVDSGALTDGVSPLLNGHALGLSGHLSLSLESQV